MTTCPSLTTITNETRTITINNYEQLLVSTYDRTPGTEVKVACQIPDELELVGSSTLICMAAGIWAPSPLPTCKIRTTTTTKSTTTGNTMVPGMSDVTILTIVLSVIAVFVFIVILVICIAIYRRKWYMDKKRAVSRSTNSDAGSTYSLSNSISRRYNRNSNVHVLSDSRFLPDRYGVTPDVSNSQWILRNSELNQNRRGSFSDRPEATGQGHSDVGQGHRLMEWSHGDWDNRRIKCPYCPGGHHQPGKIHGKSSQQISERNTGRTSFSNWSLRIPRPAYEY